MRSHGNTPIRAAVVSDETVTYPDGTTKLVPRPPYLDPVGMLDRMSRGGELESTILLDSPRARATLMEHEQQIRTAGWQFSTIGPWTLFRRRGQAVTVGILQGMHDDLHRGVLIESGRVDPGRAAWLLQQYRDLTGVCWRGTAAMTAAAQIRSHWTRERYQPLWTHDAVGRGVGFLSWSRPLDLVEQTPGYRVHQYDLRTSYLSAAINAELAWSRLDRTGAMPFNPAAPGYWLLRLDTSTWAMLSDRERPPVIDPKRVQRDGGTVWVTTPIAKLLLDMGHAVDVIDSYTAVALFDGGRRIHPAASRILRPWGEQLRDALQHATDERLVFALKRTYKDAVGGLQRKGARIYRPDWAHTVIDLARANLIRRIEGVRSTGQLVPVRVYTDAVWYAIREEQRGQLEQMLGVKDGLGGFRPEGSLSVHEYAEKYESKGARRG